MLLPSAAPPTLSGGRINYGCNVMKDAFMQEAVELAVENVKTGRGGPFAALVVKAGTVVARGTNLVTSSLDPTAHAEIVAIRAACRTLNVFHLQGCDLYTTCEPCPMCLGAIYWAHVGRVFYGATREDAATAGFDDHYIYKELALAPRDRHIEMVPMMRDEALRIFDAWEGNKDRIAY